MQEYVGGGSGSGVVGVVQVKKGIHHGMSELQGREDNANSHEAGMRFK